MPALIDCYNVLHEPMPPSLAGLDTAGLCVALSRTSWRSTGVVVVCDGAPGALGLLESPVEGVELVYSGGGRSADAEIIDRINAHTAPRRLVVVSSDHEIQQAARRRRARVWTSERFVAWLASAMGRRTPRTDKPSTGKLDPDSARAWLKEFGVAPPEEGEPAEPREHPHDEDDKHWPPEDVTPI